MSNFYCTKCHKVINGSSDDWGIYKGLPYCKACLKIIKKEQMLSDLILTAEEIAKAKRKATNKII
jgi:NAD-dependent SIR2 family protein deacetylase